MNLRSTFFILGAVLAATAGLKSSEAGFTIGYGFDNALQQQTVGFSPPTTGSSIVGNTNPGPVYDVTATTLESGVVLRGNGGHVGNNADAGNNIVGLKALKFVAESGYAWTYFDFQLDSTIVKDPALVAGKLELTIKLYDAFDNFLAHQLLDFPHEGDRGENQHYFAKAFDGAQFSRIDILYAPTYNTNNRIHEIHNIDVATVPAAPVPEPASLAVWAMGAAGMAFGRRRGWKLKFSA